MMTIKTRTGVIAYDEIGTGAPLVLLHANPGDHRDFLTVAGLDGSKGC
jgi:hypothetical protein